jgi:hypothetical protein
MAENMIGRAMARASFEPVRLLDEVGAAEDVAGGAMAVWLKMDEGVTEKGFEGVGGLWQAT